VSNKNYWEDLNHQLAYFMIELLRKNSELTPLDWLEMCLKHGGIPMTIGDFMQVKHGLIESGIVYQSKHVGQLYCSLKPVNNP
jgi:hypothetical protein